MHVARRMWRCWRLERAAASVQGPHQETVPIIEDFPMLARNEYGADLERAEQIAVRLRQMPAYIDRDIAEIEADE